MTSEMDKAALTAKVRRDLAACEARLLADLSAVIAQQHETFLQDIVGQLNSSSLRDCASTAEPALPELTILTPSKPPATTKSKACVLSQEQSLNFMERKEREQQQATYENVKPISGHVAHHDSKPNARGSVSNEEDGKDFKPKVDAGFGSIFAASALESTDLEEPHYHVEEYYSTEGWAQHLARDERFSNVTLAVIALNAVYIGVDADWNSAEMLYDANGFFIFMDNAFCLFFSFELLVRFLAFRNKKDAFKDGWFRFDTFLVAIMVLETWIMAPMVAVMTSGGGVAFPVQPLRLLRLLRLTRMTRLMRSLPELVTMTKGMKVASRAVFSSLLMVALLIYTFAIVLNMFLKEMSDINDALAPRNFKTIPSTMWTLLMDGTFMDSTGDVLTALLFSADVSCIFSCILFMAFILFSAITVMNMLIGVLCEVVSAVAQAEKDEADIALTKQSILVNLRKFDNGEGKITGDQLTRVFQDKTAKKVLKQLNIDQLFLSELQQLMFPNPDSTVSIRAIMELMLMCRGDLPVTVQHIASAQAALLCTLEKFEHRVTESFEMVMRSEMETQREVHQEVLRNTASFAKEMTRESTSATWASTIDECTSQKLEYHCPCALAEGNTEQALANAPHVSKCVREPTPARDPTIAQAAVKENCEDFCTPSGSPRQIVLM